MFSQTNGPLLFKTNPVNLTAINRAYRHLQKCLSEESVFVKDATEVTFRGPSLLLCVKDNARHETPTYKGLFKGCVAIGFTK